MGFIYFNFESDLMHLVQAFILLPANSLNFGGASIGILTHCRLGYFRFFGLGLYFPLSLFNFRAIIVDFWQIGHCFIIV
jgi:hypothetical protein